MERYRAYDREVLNRLIDKYEQSKLSAGKNTRTQHIWFPVTAKTLPDYFDLTKSFYEEVNRQLMEAEEAGYVELFWKNQIFGHILEKVRLCTENLTEIYTFLERNPKRSKDAALLSFMDSSKATSPAVLNCFTYLRLRLQEGLSIKKYADLDNLSEFHDVVKGAEALYQQKEECFEREFSMAVYDNSKTFEKLQGKILSIYKDFGDGEETLEDFGVLKKPVIVQLKGKASVSLGEGGFLDLCKLQQGIGISGQDLNSIVFSSAVVPKAVITIENLTAFYRFSEENVLVIYLGGFAGESRVALLRTVAEAFPKTPFLHFGDIDLGGFRILLDIRKKTGIDIRSLYMGEEQLRSCQSHCRPLTESDVKGLKKMQTSELSMLPDAMKTEMDNTISYMLEENCKLEQELIAFQLQQ